MAGSAGQGGTLKALLARSLWFLRKESAGSLPSQGGPLSKFGRIFSPAEARRPSTCFSVSTPSAINCILQTRPNDDTSSLKLNGFPPTTVFREVQFPDAHGRENGYPWRHSSYQQAITSPSSSRQFRENGHTNTDAANSLTHVRKYSKQSDMMKELLETQRMYYERRRLRNEARNEAPKEESEGALFKPSDSQHSEINLAGLTAMADQPPATQPLTGPLRPRSPEERKLADLVARPDLMMTRLVEWANVVVGFEQQNRYIIMDPHKGLTVGFILERSNPLLRQFLRSRRYFDATFYNAVGEELCVVRRPFYFISSTLTVEMGGQLVGRVVQQWHLWKRNYNVYVNLDGTMRQFGEVSNPGFWWWTFTVKDEHGEPLAEVDRTWRGLGLELFTDAGRYFVRFGDVSAHGDACKAPDPANILAPPGGPLDRSSLQQMTLAAEQIPPLEAARPLSLVERAVVLALAVSLDNDFFSRHSSEAGGMLPWALLGSSE